MTSINKEYDSCTGISQDEIDLAERIKEYVRRIPFKERKKFSSNKSRGRKKGLSETEATLKAALFLRSSEKDFYENFFEPSRKILLERNILLSNVSKNASDPADDVLDKIQESRTNDVMISTDSTQSINPSESQVKFEESTDSLISSKTNLGGNPIQSVMNFQGRSALQSIVRDGISVRLKFDQLILDQGKNETKDEISKTLNSEEVGDGGCENYRFFHKLSLFGFIVGTSTLIFYAALAGSFTVEAWYLSIFFEVSGTLFLVYPAKRIFSKIALKCIGAFCVAISFNAMQVGIENETAVEDKRKQKHLEKIEILSKQIELETSEIKESKRILFDLPSNRLTKRIELQKSIDEKVARVHDLSMQRMSLESDSNTIYLDSDHLEKRDGLNSYRRLLIIAISLVCGHAFFNNFRKKDVRLKKRQEKM